MQAKIKSKLKACRLVATDVDGVLTDGKITYSSNGEELKSFDIQDGLGIKLLQKVGVQVAIITGRSSPMVERRAKELGIEQIIQGREDKHIALTALCKDLDIPLENCLYIGDDLPDLKAIMDAGLGVAPANANSRVLGYADYCCEKSGGHGAMREIAELVVQAKGEWDKVLEDFGVELE